MIIAESTCVQHDWPCYSWCSQLHSSVTLHSWTAPLEPVLQILVSTFQKNKFDSLIFNPLSRPAIHIVLTIKKVSHMYVCIVCKYDTIKEQAQTNKYGEASYQPLSFFLPLGTCRAWRNTSESVWQWDTTWRVAHWCHDVCHASSLELKSRRSWCWVWLVHSVEQWDKDLKIDWKGNLLKTGLFHVETECQVCNW